MGVRQVRARLFLVLVMVFVVYTVASAQEYSVRTNRRINLRVTHSLQGRIVETVASGTVLPVVGSVEDWLKIDRRGDTVWMADWVNFTRVEGNLGTQSQVDNCCYVDRECNSDSEWIDGY